MGFESHDLTDVEEQEVIFINTQRPEPSQQYPLTFPGRGVGAIWQRSSMGCIDPRPFIMSAVSESFECILGNGGLFIVMLSEEYQIDYTIGKHYGDVIADEDLAQSSWGFLRELTHVNRAARNGQEITFVEPLLQRGASNARYRTAIASRYSNDSNWTTIATNKLGEPVGAILTNDNRPGRILLLPQMPDFASVIVPLLTEWCSQWAPKFFPDHGASRWLMRPEYEQPAINDRRRQIDGIMSESAAQIASLEAEIVELRDGNENWYSLLNGTGRDLVLAVIDAFRQLGFKNVIDVDEHEDPNNLREDIQILDGDPPLVVDVKGVNGTPSDDESTQSVKHALMRVRDLNRYCKPLTVINSQRNVPPHDRDQIAFRKEIVENAERTDLGLMTTWDLFQLLRNIQRLGWDPSVVKPIPYRSGRISPVPENYSLVGSIVHVWEHSFGIIPSLELKVGMRVSIQLRDQFYEIPISTIQVDGHAANQCPASANCGLAYPTNGPQLREGASVFVVTS